MGSLVYPMKQSLRKILIIGPAWIGDMIMAQALFKLLKQLHPQVEIDVLTNEWCYSLLEFMPEINRGWLAPFAHGELNLHGRYALAKKLRTLQYDQAIILPNSFKSALIPFFAKVPLRTGWKGELRWGLINDIRHLNKKKYPLMVEQFLALGLPTEERVFHQLFFPALQIHKKSRDEILKKFNLNIQDSQILAICPGAEYGPAKRWPTEHFIKLVQEKMTQNWQVWILGSQKENDMATAIQKATGCINFAGRTSLKEAVYLLASATAVVTNDSGLMHIAAALHKPLVVIYGSSSPQFTPPLTSQAKIVSLKLNCSPCFARVCPLGHFKCMRDLLPKTVLKALNDLIVTEV